MTNAATNATPEVLIFLCRNCFPGIRFLPMQWSEAGMHIRVKEIPCSGKIDAQYILHALESGVLGVCVITCPQGACTLTQGNYRADVRVRTVRRLLEEAGTHPGRAQIIHCAEGSSPDQLRELVNEEVRAFSTLVGIQH
jgi:coenzyme F420-reducing hydrogenase delta subunit